MFGSGVAVRMPNKPSYKEFKHLCPKCNAKDKVIVRCIHCHGYMCSECSKENLCVDCYIDIYSKHEKEVYTFDKIKGVIPT